MELIPKELLESIPKLYETEDVVNPTCHIKLFTPDANFTWYIIEISIDKKHCYGYVESLDNELGYFSLDEIKELKGPLGLKVERDLSFTPKPLSELRKGNNDD